MAAGSGGYEVSAHGPGGEFLAQEGGRGACACPSMWDELRQAVEFQPCEMAPECLSRDFVEPERVLT